MRRPSDIHIHGFTALEVTEGARRSEVPLAEYLTRLKDAGLKTLPGTAAEILDDDVRARLCPDKINTEEWLDAHRTAHAVGLRSNITIMFGSIEQPVSWARHIVRTRALQRETGGFTEFVPLPFVHMAAPIYLQHKARRGPTFREALLMHSVARIAYAGDIDNIQVSWVKMGAEGARQVLRAGANDLGGTLMDENISRAAGAQHGQRMGVEDLEAIVAPLGRPLVQRSTLYALAESAPRPDRTRRTAEETTWRRSSRRDDPGRLGDGRARSSLRHGRGSCARRLRHPVRGRTLSAAQARELQAMIGVAGDMAGEGTSVGDLKIAEAALGEMAEAFRVFRPYRHIRKMTMFGSARTRPDDPVYILARNLAATWPPPTGWS